MVFRLLSTVDHPEYVQQARFSVLVMYRPDRDGYLPWDHAASDWVRGHQPLVFEKNS